MKLTRQQMVAMVSRATMWKKTGAYERFQAAYNDPRVQERINQGIPAVSSFLQKITGSQPQHRIVSPSVGTIKRR